MIFIPGLNVDDSVGGSSSQVEVASRLSETIFTFSHALGEPTKPLRVRRSPYPYPITDWNEENGSTVIYLSAFEPLAQMTYQFAHEFCHSLSNYRFEPRSRFRWLEEALCEAASQFALVTQRAKYAEYGVHQILLHHQLEPRNPPGDFTSWFGAHYSDLCQFDWDDLNPKAEQADRVRTMTFHIGKELYPLFLASPERWAVLRQLNKWDSSSQSDDGFFTEWQARLPLEPFHET